MMLTRKAISRRTALRGLGTAVALPLLDAMVPALTALQKTPAAPVRRLGVVYHPNGVIYENWLPNGTGRDFTLSPILEPLEPFRNRLVVVTGLPATRPRRSATAAATIRAPRARTSPASTSGSRTAWSATACRWTRLPPRRSNARRSCRRCS